MFSRFLHLSFCVLCAWHSATIQAANDTKPEAVETIPESIKAPAGSKLLFTAIGKGVQIYKSIMADGKLVWKFEAPRAELTGADGNAVWKHFAGPTWEAPDGSKVKKIDAKEAVTQTAAPNAKDDIPWLLIKVKPEGDKTGILSQVRCVQRVHTKGGKMPAQPPTQLDARIEIEYAATYNFYGSRE